MKAPENDPFLIMRPNLFATETPKKLLPYLETVRRASQWKAIGFPVSMDQFGFPHQSNLKTYRFVTVDPTDPTIAEGIETGKKATRDPIFVVDYVLAGCVLNEFVTLPEDVVCFCQGRLLAAQGNQAQATQPLTRAVQIQPENRNYREALYWVRLSLNDLSAIDEEFEFFRSDMDSLFHSGRVEIWLQALLKGRQFSKAREVIEKVDNALLELERGTLKPRFFAVQKPEWYASKHQQFLRFADKFRGRIRKLEGKVT